MNRTDSAEVELDSLIGLFYDDPQQLGRFEQVSADEVPAPAKALLAHDYHMTVTVEHYHGCPVDVKVHQTLIQGDDYSRKIILTRQSDDHVVMFGIVRLNMSLLSPGVRAEIESQQTPLGRILIKHNVLRAVKLLRLFRIQPGNDLRSAMGLNESQVCFGRTALIYCDGSPAIELLEIVAQ